VLTSSNCLSLKENWFFFERRAPVMVKLAASYFHHQSATQWFSAASSSSIFLPRYSVSGILGDASWIPSCHRSVPVLGGNFCSFPFWERRRNSLMFIEGGRGIIGERRKGFIGTWKYASWNIYDFTNFSVAWAELSYFLIVMLTLGISRGVDEKLQSPFRTDDFISILSIRNIFRNFREPQRLWDHFKL